MTVVACFQCHGQPLIIGDLMLSSWSEKPPATLPFNIPTIPDVNAKIPLEWGSLVVGLRQKIVVLDDTFAIAWAGSFLAARVVVRELNELIVKGPLRFEQIQEVLNKAELGTQDLFIAGLLVQREYSDRLVVTRFSWDTNAGWTKLNPQVRGLDPIYMGGSGESDLVKVMSAATTSLGNSAPPSSCATAISVAISMTNLLSGEQSRTASGVSALYGGGFEVATIIDGRISKVGGVSHFFMDALRLPHGGIKVQLRRAISYNYKGDVLVVNTIELEMELEWTVVDEKIELSLDSQATGDPAIYAIFPVHRSPSESERQEFAANPPCSFSSRFTALYVHLPQRNGHVVSLVHYTADDAPVLALILNDGDVDLQFGHSFFDKLNRCLRDTGN